MKEIEENRLLIGIREWAIDKSLNHFPQRKVEDTLPPIEKILQLAKKYEKFAVTGEI